MTTRADHPPPTDGVIHHRATQRTGRTGGRYHDFNVSHLVDLLARDEGIKIPRSTLSRLLIAHHIRQPQRTKAAVKRMQRERKSAEGIAIAKKVTELLHVLNSGH